MFEYPQYDENGQEKLFFPNVWRNIQSQEIIGAECFNPNAALNPNENLIVLKLTAIEFTQIYSALYNGAVMAYPDTFLQILINFLKGLHCPPLMEEQECFEYPTYANFIAYEPENPYIEPDFVPDGYLIPPFQVNGQNGVDYPDYQEFDIITPFGAFEFLGNWFDIMDGFLPQITVMVNGIGTVSIKLLTLFNGGMACVTVDAPPNLIDIFGGIVTGADNILDLNLDTFSIPPETAQEVIYEVELTTAGIHTIYITFLPVVDDTSIPIRYGGGFRGVTLCNFVEQPMTGIQNIRFDAGSCELQILENGEWAQVAGWENWLDCVPSGDPVGGGGSVNTKVLKTALGGNSTTTSVIYVALPGATVNFTPSKSKMLVFWDGVTLQAGLAANSTLLRIKWNGTLGLDTQDWFQRGIVLQEVPLADRWENLDIGVAHAITLEWRASAGTSTFVPNDTGRIVIIEYDDDSDIFVEDIRIFEGELQKKIGGAWLAVTDSFEAIINSLQSQITNTTAIANSAVANNVAQQAQINSIISVNNTQNSRLTVLEDDVEDLILSVTGINTTLSTHTTQIAALQSITGILGYGGAWATTQNYDASAYFWSQIIGDGYVAGQGWLSNSNGVTIAMSDARLAECQCTHVYARVAMINPPTGSLQWRVQGGAYGSLKYNGSGGSISDGWLRVPNWTGTNFQIELSGFGDFYLRSVYFIGRGSHNPFA